MENLGTYLSIYKALLSIFFCLRLGDISVDNNVNYETPIQEVTEENNISYWDRDHSCDILERMGLLPVFVLQICQRPNSKFLD